VAARTKNFPAKRMPVVPSRSEIFCYYVEVFRHRTKTTSSP
jgi:hypothetical protein